MVRNLLVRGMLVGILAGLLAFGFLKVFGEPQVDRAIAFEARMEQAKAATEAAGGSPAAEEEPELVSRPVQAGIGLFTGVVVFGAAIGGLFALVFASASGRLAATGPRATAAILAAIGFVTVYLAPFVKYPANPPAVGEPETIQIRTALYFAMILISVVAMLGAVLLRRRLVGRHGAWNASLFAGLAYLLVIVVANFALPTVNEVPEQFPADLLWQFRIASVGAQVILWTTLGLAFGPLAEHAMRRQATARHVLAAS
ncbi:Predicted cobalt transporter CbtA [Rhodovastum atsumiense]|uniref:CbtA family protein n=1 Tax=Rhodovastum atsumiense TaxID=504468 RepID=A0A5M6IWA4_9PROT|nr:CbtA family protein [Rhodovastum atsumiense]KAA5612107.1 CbtA family protein [Rhodovastum atsumiense]CAH2604008.1 Predicted cobalt transporter CbtA [Rhodovastum atsumiense]